MLRRFPTLAAALAALALAAPAAAQPAQPAPPVPLPGPEASAGPASPLRDQALNARGVRLVVSLYDRQVWLMDGRIALYTAPVAVGKEVVMEYEGRVWDFTTPRGIRRVLGKERNPMWTAPDWHYVELAAMQGWKLVWLQGGERVPLAEGGYVTTRGGRVGRVAPDGTWHPVERGDEAVFGDTLFAPPPGSANRTMPGILGAYKLDTGSGIYLHGTPELASVGRPATHGCLRLLDGDLEYLYRHVSVGTPIYIY
ncbi:L,D-transpeptidase [Longimicrobium sp.]|uniref:L,D-transpeptidase n=1 Tax=Longimicrobium sp. TaxID=2029185 RepID=UPI002C16D2BB|nr:L,D-transpeptidase [Longimicrobium sp.]HSU13305.1 L,D-transpeptidase [Longimicrobium sp.]